MQRLNSSRWRLPTCIHSSWLRISMSGGLTYDWQRPWKSSELPSEAAASGDDAEGPGWNDEDDDGPPSYAEAGDILGELLLHLKHQGIITARQCCTIAYWAWRAGATGPVSDIQWRPDLPNSESSHYARHLDRVTKKKDMDSKWYNLRAPGYDKSNSNRVQVTLTLSPPHERLAEEVIDNPGIVEEVQRRSRDGEWPERYMSHPVVRGAPEGTTVIPDNLVS